MLIDHLDCQHVAENIAETFSYLDFSGKWNVIVYGNKYVRGMGRKENVWVEIWFSQEAEVEVSIMLSRGSQHFIRNVSRPILFLRRETRYMSFD